MRDHEISVSPASEDRARSTRRFLRLSLGFWSGTTRAQAWLLTSAILLFLFANLGAALAVNRWNKFFFDALEQKRHADRHSRSRACSRVGTVVGGIFSGAAACAHAPAGAVAAVVDAHIDRALARGPAFLSTHHRAHRGRQSRSAHRRGRQDCDRAPGRFFARRSERRAGRGLLHRHPLGRRRLSDRGGLFHSRLHGVRLHHLFGDHDAQHVPAGPAAGAPR